MQFCTILVVAVATCTSMGLVIPEPEGPYAVSMSVKVLTDHSRIDPYAPGRQDRQVVVSTFLPVHETTIRCEKTIAPYMTPLVAAEYDQIAASVGLSNETFSALELSLCSPVKPRQCQSSLPLERFPVLIFSPGLGDPRLLYGATAKTIASLGYAVVTIDHPYDASIVEFPDGKVVTAANINPAKASDLEKATRVRSADVSFVLDQLHNTKTLQSMVGFLASTVNANEVIVGGHSLGGATAAAAMLGDLRFLGGVNLDGQLVEPVESAGLNKTFVQAGRPHHSAEDPTWNIFWAQLRGPRSEVEVDGAVHGTFTDIPTLLAAVNPKLSPAQKVALQNLAGTIDWADVSKIIAAIFDATYFYVSGQGIPTLLQSKNPYYPQVEVLKARL